MNENNVLDVAVIGAGPAGLTAGLYAARAGLSVAIYERISPGGQLAQTERVENYPGFAEGADGFELAWAMKEQAEHFGAIIVSEEVTAVDFSGEVKMLTTPFGQHKARSVIVATGARPRKMGLAGEERLGPRRVVLRDLRRQLLPWEKRMRARRREHGGGGREVPCAHL